MGISDIVGIVADIATVVALAVGIFQYVRAVRRENRFATLDAYRELQRDALDELNRNSMEEIREALKDKRSEEYVRLGSLLARVEHFCVGINQDIYDFDTFYEVADGYFYGGEKATLYRRLVPIIDRKNEGAPKDYFQNIHKVWERMETYSRTKDNRGAV